MMAPPATGALTASAAQCLDDSSWRLGRCKQSILFPWRTVAKYYCIDENSGPQGTKQPVMQVWERPARQLVIIGAVADVINIKYTTNNLIATIKASLTR